MAQYEPMQDEIETFTGRAGAFATSDLFPKLFEDGMALVEETARYLDNDGRTDAKGLDRGPALAYATVSMRLTTKLMQIASWLLVLRAVREGKMSEEDALASKHRLKPARKDIIQTSFLPARLGHLNEKAKAAYERLQRIDAALVAEPAANTASLEADGDGDAVVRLAALQRAFGE